MKKSKLSLNEEIRVIRRLSGLNEGLVDDITDKLKELGQSAIDKFEDFMDVDSDEDKKEGDDTIVDRIKDFFSDIKEVEEVQQTIIPENENINTTKHEITNDIIVKYEDSANKSIYGNDIINLINKKKHKVDISSLF